MISHKFLICERWWLHGVILMGLCEGCRTFGFVSDILSNLTRLSASQPLISTDITCVVICYAAVVLESGHCAAESCVVTASTFVAGVWYGFLHWHCWYQLIPARMPTRPPTSELKVENRGLNHHVYQDRRQPYQSPSPAARGRTAAATPSLSLNLTLVACNSSIYSTVAAPVSQLSMKSTGSEVILPYPKSSGSWTPSPDRRGRRTWGEDGTHNITIISFSSLQAFSCRVSSVSSAVHNTLNTHLSSIICAIVFQFSKPCDHSAPMSQTDEYSYVWTTCNDIHLALHYGALHSNNYNHPTHSISPKKQLSSVLSM